jgi:hypothetical protein
MKTPEELAEDYVENYDEMDVDIAEEAFLAGYHSRDLEVTSLEEEIAMLKAELREVGNE